MRTLVAFFFIFTFGFLTHAFIFPDFLSRTIDLDSAKERVLGQNEESEAPQKSLTIAVFKNGSFHPSKIWITKGYYVGIKNENEKVLMWLSSDKKELTTVRGYGFGEQLTALMPDAGTFQVIEKDSGSKLTIVVQKN